MAGYHELVRATRAAIGPEKLMVANLVRARFPDAGLGELGAFDGSYLEAFETSVGTTKREDYVAKGIAAAQEAARRGKIVALTAGVGRIVETPATLNHHWGFVSYDQAWKTPAQLLHKLVDIVSKGGNYLLNVGPDATGVIPRPSQDALREMGRWLKLNGEAIYGAGPTPFGEELGKVTGTRIVETDGRKSPVEVVEGDQGWRCTTKPGKIYLHFFQWPGGEFALGGLKTKVTGAYLLADRRALAFSFAKGALTVPLRAKTAGELPMVLCLECAQ